MRAWWMGALLVGLAVVWGQTAGVHAQDAGVATGLAAAEAWTAARLDVQRGEGARAWATLRRAGLEGAPAGEAWQAGVRAVAAEAALEPGAGALFALVNTDGAPPAARLVMLAHQMRSCPLPCPPPEVDLEAARALPPATLNALLLGMARVKHNGTLSLARRVAADAPWTRGPAPPHERAELAATTHSVLTAGKDKLAVDLGWWAWQYLPTEPALKNVVTPLTEEAARKVLGVPGLMRHLQSRLEANDNAAAVEMGRRLCGDVLQKDGKPCPAMGAEACEVAFITGKSMRQMRAYAEAEATLTPVVAHCPQHAARALFIQGKAMAAQEGGTPRAVATYEALARKHKDSPLADDALVAAGQLSARGKGAAAARKSWERVVKSFPEGDMAPEAAWFLAWQAHLDGKDEDARARLAAMVEKEKDRSALHWRRALYWNARLQPDDEAAAVALTAVVNTVPQTFEAALARGWLERHGKPVPLENPFANAAQPPTPPANPDGLARAAMALEAMGLDADAALFYRHSSHWTDKAVGGDVWVASRLVELGDAPNASRGMRVRYARIIKGTPTPENVLYWQLAWPRAHLAAIEAGAREQKLPTSMLMALAREESAFDARVSSWAGAIGLTQLMPATAQMESDALGVSRPSLVALLDPVLNARLGAAHLARHLREFNGNAACGLGAYNAGPSRVRTWLKRAGAEDLDAFVEQVPIDETRGYIKRVLDSYAHYRLLLGEDGPLVLPQKATDAMVPLN